MKKSRKNNVTIQVKVATREDFFARGKRLAKLADKGETLEQSRTISFEDTNDLVRFLTKMKLTLLAALRKQPDSISGLAKKLHRSRSSVDKDVKLLESVGIVQSEYQINPGHGRCRMIKAVDSRPIKLKVETFI